MNGSDNRSGRVSRLLAVFGTAALMSSTTPCLGQPPSDPLPEPALHQCPESKPRYLGEGGGIALGAFLGGLVGLRFGGPVGQGAGAAMGAAAGADSNARPTGGQLDVTAMNRQQREMASSTGCTPRRYIRN